MATREGPQRQGLGRYGRLLSLPVPPYVTVPGLIVHAEATAATEVSFETPLGRFALEPAELAVGEPRTFLDGAVVVDRVPAAEMLSDYYYEDDFITLLGGSGEELWAAWIGYREGTETTRARRWNGDVWEPMSGPGSGRGDRFRMKLGRDRQGRVWAVWSEQKNGNWDLYGCYLAGEDWSVPERLTTDAQPDAFHNLATDANGHMWLAWQGFRNGQADIFARRFDGDTWSPAERVSTSPANDWEPAIAVDATGRVYVAWDSYDEGNYDVIMRSFSQGPGPTLSPSLPPRTTKRTSAWHAIARTVSGPPGTRAAPSGARIPASTSSRRERSSTSPARSAWVFTKTVCGRPRPPTSTGRCPMISASTTTCLGFTRTATVACGFSSATACCGFGIRLIRETARTGLHGKYGERRTRETVG